MNRFTLIFMIVIGNLPYANGSEQVTTAKIASRKSLIDSASKGQGLPEKKLAKSQKTKEAKAQEKKIEEKKRALQERLAATITQEISYLSKNRGALKLFPNKPLMCAALSRRGSYYALGSKKGAVFIGDAKTGTEKGTLSGHEAAVTWIAFSPDGSKLLTCSMDSTAKLWDRATMKLEHTLSGHKGVLFTGSFSPDGRRVVTGSFDRTVRVWNVKTGKVMNIFPLGFCVDAVSFADEGAYLYATALNGSVKKWKSTGGEQIRSVRGPQGPLAVSEFSLDGTRVFSGTYIGTVIEWNPRTGKILQTIDLGEHLKIFALALSGKMTRVLAGCSDGTGRLIDRASGKEIMRLIGTKKSLQSVALSVAAERAITVSHDGTARLYDLSMDSLNRLKETVTQEQALFLKEAYKARLKKAPLALLSRVQCDLLLSFEKPLVSYLKDAFLLQVDPSSERASIDAKKDILE